MVQEAKVVVQWRSREPEIGGREGLKDDSDLDANDSGKLVLSFNVSNITYQ
jgi:hypothetical protein